MGVTSQEVTIASGSTTSAAVAKRFGESVGVILPSTFDGTALTVSVSDSEDGTFVVLKNTSGAISTTVAASSAYQLPAELRPFPWFKLISGTSQSTTDTVVTVFLED